jgi:hypothetical protein
MIRFYCVENLKDMLCSGLCLKVTIQWVKGVILINYNGGFNEIVR